MPFQPGTIHWEDFINEWRSGPADLEHAIADIIDNALDVGATIVDIEIYLLPNKTPALVIYDNGLGFTNLFEAFDLGNPEGTERGELATGKFHVGLKKSAMTVCKQLTVLTIPPDKKKVIYRRLSLEEIQKNKSWGSDDKESSEFPSHYLKQAKQRIKSGKYRTAVMLDRFDRVSFQPDKPNEEPEKTLKKRLDPIFDHLGLVFARRLEIGRLKDVDFHYLDSPYRVWYLNRLDKAMKRPTIRLNQGLVDPIDPFYSHLISPNVRKLTQDIEFSDMQSKLMDFIPWSTVWTKFPLEWEGETIVVNAFVIPKNDFVGTGKHQLGSKLKSPSKTKSVLKPDLMGLYLFRNDRLIAYGTKGLLTKRGWYGVVKNPENEHQDMRIALDIPKSLDSEFKLASMKNGYEPPFDFIDDLRNKLTQVERVYPNVAPLYKPGNKSKPMSIINLGKERYNHSIKKKATCSICTGVHEDKHCPKMVCDKCGIEGHSDSGGKCTADDCQTPDCLAPSTHTTDRCPKCNCGRRGHENSQCRFRCGKCQEFNPDHTDEECPNCPACSRSKEDCRCPPAIIVSRSAGSMTVELTPWKVPDEILSWIEGTEDSD